MEKRVVIDQITIDVKNGGHRLYKLCKQIIDDDGVTVLSEQPHRTSVEPGGDMAEQLAIVNEHLENGMKVGKMSEAEVQLIVDLDTAMKPLLEDKKAEWEAKRETQEGRISDLAEGIIEK